MSGTQNVIVRPTAPAPTPAPRQAPQQPAFDPDDEVAAARAEAALEEASAAARADIAPARPAPSTRFADTAPAKPAPMVPAARLAEVSRDRTAARDEVARLRGVIEGMRQGPATGPAQPQAPAAPTIEQQLQQQTSIIVEAAGRFDSGAISMVEYENVRLAAQDVIDSLKANHLLAHIQATIQPANTEPGLADATILDRHVQEMAQTHPYSAVLNTTEIDLLARIVRAEAIARNQPFGRGPAEDMRLRQGIAELSDFWGPRWYPQGHPSLRQAAAAPPPPAPQQTAAPSQRAQTGAAALALASRQPPNTATVGRAASGGTGDPTESEIMAMSEDEIQALPPPVRRRLLALTE